LSGEEEFIISYAYPRSIEVHPLLCDDKDAEIEEEEEEEEEKSKRRECVVINSVFSKENHYLLNNF